MRRTTLIAMLIVGLMSSAARADVPPDYGFQWATIGDAGNRPTLPAETPVHPTAYIGSVDYEFRMSTTEVTVGQWLEFVRAYTPYYTGSANNVSFLGFRILNSGSGYVIFGDPNRSTEMSWSYAARYCNWLCNGKALTREAFENGAYDTSTFTFNPDGTANHQIGHNPNAEFWIPTLDEWTKAVYWDPNKPGTDGGGYWQYPGASDVPLTPGSPSNGGQTNAGRDPMGQAGPDVVGAYPAVTAPWGLLDASGGRVEWTESTPDPSLNNSRFTKGSSRGSTAYIFQDMLDNLPEASVNIPAAGLRLASKVPSPGATVVIVIAMIPRRRRAT